ncbi:hypothetical protein OGAPHI_006451 [Ogataea philodendri]|uniref:Uncharacterized protein n=1 Tax=Ogataea philodendri TaxID=1378263 RepID=A0A9P8NXA6_9ASCO|nr:uncharacterized protein OGAPHI_006451 [Ogataea philodendri]KAH3661603.1 hypothetical protein OGAPHI_006451 [Ogataea philodendri]
MNQSHYTQPEYYEQWPTPNAPPASSVDIYDDHSSSIQRAGLRQTHLSAQIQQQQKKKHRPKTMLFAPDPNASLMPPVGPYYDASRGHSAGSFGSVGSASNGPGPYAYHEYYQPHTPYAGSQHSLPYSGSQGSLTGAPGQRPVPQYARSQMLGPGLRKASPATPGGGTANHAARLSINSALSFVGYSPKRPTDSGTPDSTDTRDFDSEYRDTIDDDYQTTMEMSKLSEEVRSLQVHKSKSEQLEQTVGVLESENEALRKRVQELEAENAQTEKLHHSHQDSYKSTIVSMISLLPDYIKNKHHFLEFTKSVQLDQQFEQQVSDAAESYTERPPSEATDEKVLEMFRQEVRSLNETVIQMEKRKLETETVLKQQIQAGNKAIKRLATRSLLHGGTGPAGLRRELRFIDIVEPQLNVEELKQNSLQVSKMEKVH